MGCVNSQATILTQPLPKSVPLQSKKPSPQGAQSLQALPHTNFAQQQKIGDKYFQEGKFVNAIATYKKIIEGGYSVDFEIEGLGNYDHSTNRYQWFIYRWYNQQRKAGKFKGNVFDALSLCFCSIRNDDESTELQKGMLWYQDMLAEKPSYELEIGYANILYSKERYDDALKIYRKIIEARPKLINIYVSIMFLHQFRRVQKNKSIEMAKKILEINPQNMYAQFVLSKNESNIDQKINKLKLVAEKYPKYVRCVNEVGIAYGVKKQHKQALVWYTKCVKIAPQYAQGYANIAYRTQMLEEQEEALSWYFKAFQVDHKYKAAYKNAIKLFQNLEYTDEDIIEEMKEYQVDPKDFYYRLGIAYQGLQEYKKAINWYKRSQELGKDNYKLLNSMGYSYCQMKDYTNAQKYYLKSIQLNPKYKHPPMNLGTLYKRKNQRDKAIEWYKKAIDVDPYNHFPYNNLGNVYRDRKQYQKAIDTYKQCLQVNSTYTLVFVNMGICYLNQQMYQDAFAAFARAKELLATDKSDMRQANRTFLKQNLQKFDQEGQKWRKTGSIGKQQKQRLRQLISSFQSNFQQLYSSEVSAKMSDQKVLKPQVLQIINLIYEDQFQLKNIHKIFSLVKHIFHDDQDYFHIVPQLFIQYFWNNAFKKNIPILQVQENLNRTIRQISNQQSNSGPSQGQSQQPTLNSKMKYFDPPNNYPVNLFKDTVYFDNYETLYNEIDKVNKLAEQSLPEFKQFVDAVRKRSDGILYGVNMKLPKKSQQQFKAILRILEKMFKKEITKDRVKSIISKIGQQLKKGGKTITLVNIVHLIINGWTQQITLILKQRSKNKIQTTCAMSDMVRGKVMFNTIDDLEKAIDACDRLCHLRGYQILELDNRLAKKQTMDVVLKIKIKQAVCEFQLAMKQDQSKYHLIHSIYQIQRSPLGCIFGSYLFMSKGFSYPILANCKDIEARLKSINNEQDQGTILAAQYIIKALEEKSQPSI